MTEETLLIEIGTEELPPTRLGNLSEAFCECLSQSFQQLGIPFERSEHFASPRRLAARFFKLPSHQKARSLERRGPALQAAFDSKGQPTPAALGFARSCGVDIKDLKTLETPQGSWLVATLQEEGKTLVQLLGGLIEKALHAIPAPKRMRWGENDYSFLRPLHWITVMHGKEKCPVTVFGITASDFTYGHHFHHPEKISLKHAEQYIETLKNAHVIADHRERQEIILQEIEKVAKSHQATPLIDEALLDQVSGLVEWPVALRANFDKTFLKVPKEALISSMQNHQKCFPLQDSQGNLLPHFILIGNTFTGMVGPVLLGNERVMQARLSDAKFFYEKDKKNSLASRLEKLKQMIFQKKLGSLYDKSMRVAKLSASIAKLLNTSARLCEQTSKLYKADLLTEMVFEFPELQGTMGKYYALNDGEPPEVATAIAECYLPRTAKDKLPETPTGLAVALADRLDTLIGIFGIGQHPTGDKDPFGLRRQSLAILRILIEKELTLNLEDLLLMARQGYGALIDEETIPKVLLFCLERFKAWYQEEGIAVQTIDAVITHKLTVPYDCARRVLAVDYFKNLPEAQSLAAANKRVKNILHKNAISYSSAHLPQVLPEYLQDEAEKELFNEISKLKTHTAPLIAEGNYQEALISLSSLQKPVDTFFDTVLVMSDDLNLRKNRINLLCHLESLFMKIADVSRLAL